MALIAAQDEAMQLDHNYIGTEHLLLGILGDVEAPAGRLVASRGLTLEVGRRWLEGYVGRGSQPVDEQIGLTPRSKRAIEFAVAAAARDSGDSIDDRHLLLGVLSVTDGLAIGMLKEAAIDVDALRRAASTTASYALTDS